MGKGQGSLRRTAMIGTFVASVMLALILPSIAFATVFSSLTPKAGSSSSVSKPKISVICRDAQGIVRASKTSMTLDGVKVAKKLTWYSGWGHRKFKIAYAVPSALSRGSHKVVVRVTDRKYNHSSKTWSFTVVDPTAPVTTSDAASWDGKTGPATINLSATDNAGGSGVAHTYYKLNGGAQTEGIVIKASAVGFYTLEFWSVDNAGNTESPDTAYFQVSAASAPNPFDAIHQSAEWCAQSGCHNSSLTVVHSASACAVCHGDGPTAANAVKYGIISTAAVKAAVAAGDKNCTACHNVFNTVPAHPFMTATTHTVNNGQPTGCYDPKCHASTDVSVIHTQGDDPPGCAACHAPGKTPSLVCTKCHPNLTEVHGFVHANASGTKSTACIACHGTDLPIVHTAVGCICHTASFLRAEMTPLLAAKTAECVDCHKGTHAAHDFNNTATGHNTTTYGTIGAKTKFDGSQGVTLHTIETSATSPNFGQVATLTTDWEFPTANVFWASTDASAPADGMKGLTKDSVVTCQDCHTGLNAAGPHGATENWGIDPNYPGDFSYAELTKWIVTNPSGIKVRSTLDPRLPKDPTKKTWDDSGYTYFSGVPTTNSAINFDGENHAIICSKCHDLENFDVGMMSESAPATENWKVPVTGVATDTVTGYVNTSAIGGSNVAHGQHHFDTNDGSPQCVNCHIAIPHGWKRPRLIVNSGPGFAFKAFETSMTVPGFVNKVPFMWKDNTNAQPADPPPYRSPNQFGTSDALATYGGVVGGPWWGMEAFVAAEWGETTKPNPAQANPNPVQPLPPHDRIDDHDAMKVGMQSISGTDEHELIASSAGSNASATGHNTNYIEWVEYKCGACDFHHPSSDPRVSDPVGVGGDTIIVKE